MNIVAIILARGGSKGLPNKNILKFCGKPLISWTIQNCFDANIKSVWVSSDSDEILKISNQNGAKIIKRPDDISEDFSTSEDAWLHAYNYIISQSQDSIDWIFAPQVTSPIREHTDISKAFKILKKNNYDSIFSCCEAEDLFFWEKNNKNELKSINYDWKNRKRRQDITNKYVENGSFYFFKPSVILKGDRFGNSIGCTEMEPWKMFEIDSADDFRLCSAIMKEFLIK
jgi:N-acylneuraminate cytidylyltransferase